MTTKSGTQPRAATRLYWADAVKAIAVILVVLYHVAPTAVGWLVEGKSTGEKFIGDFSMALVPLRMPAFFLVSGILAANALRRPWRTVFQKRVLNLLWVFILWTAIYAFPYGASTFSGAHDEMRNRALMWTINFSGAYWFLPMLVIMFSLMKLLSRVHPVIILATALIARYFATSLPTFDDLFLTDIRSTVYRFCMFFIWYAIGALFKNYMTHLVTISRWLWIPAIPLFIYLTLMNVSATNTFDWSFYLSIVGIIGLVGFSELITRAERIRKLARYISTRTLPIYLFHAMLIVLLRLSDFRLPELTSLELGLLVVGMTFGLTALACLLWDILQPRLPLLFRAPNIVSALAERKK